MSAHRQNIEYAHTKKERLSLIIHVDCSQLSQIKRKVKSVCDESTLEISNSIFSPCETKKIAKLDIAIVDHKPSPREEHAESSVPKIKIRLRVRHAIEICDNTGKRERVDVMFK